MFDPAWRGRAMIHIGPDGTEIAETKQVAYSSSATSSGGSRRNRASSKAVKAAARKAGEQSQGQV